MPLIDLKSDLTWYGSKAPNDSGPQDIISRGVADTVRVTKYLTTPSGIQFLLKQAGLQLTNPNIENSLGYASVNPKATPTKQFTPINLLANVGTGGLGLRYSRHGVSPVPTLGRYEDIVVKNRGTYDEQTNRNRLVGLKGDVNFIMLGRDISFTSISNTSKSVITRLSGVTGPKSFLGVGTTNITLADRYDGIYDKNIRSWYNANQYYSIGNQYLPNAKSGTYKYDIDNLYTTKENIDENSVSTLTGNKLEPLKKKNISIFKLGKNTDSTISVSTTKNLYGFEQRYAIDAQYAARISKSTKKSANSDDVTDGNNNNQQNIDNWALTPNSNTDTTFTPIGSDYLNITVNDNTPESLTRDIPNTNNGNEALQKYATVAYNRIPKTQLHANKFNNFINQIDSRNLDGLLSGPIRKSKYDTQNVVSQFNYKHYSSRVKQNMKDINFKKDIIKFQIGGVKFRAYIDSISDSFSPSFNNEQPVGSPFYAVRYQSIERSVSVSFKIAVLVREDLEETYQNMTRLQNFAYFEEGNNSFTAKTVQVVIGNLYNFEGVIESVSYDWDSEMPWEIEEGSQVPLYCNVSVDFKYLTPKPGFNI